MSPEEAEEKLQDALRDAIDEAAAEIFDERETFRALQADAPMSATNLLGQVPEHLRETVESVFEVSFDLYLSEATKDCIKEGCGVETLSVIPCEAMQYALDAALAYTRGARIIGATKTHPPSEDNSDPYAFLEDDDD